MRCIDADTLEKILEKIPAADIKNMGGQAYVLVKLSQVFNVIDNQPTIEPEPKWIPCSERKPTSAGQYLVTKQQKTGELQRATAHYNPTFDEWSGNGNFGKVLAWMELPPVYKEDTE